MCAALAVSMGQSQGQSCKMSSFKSCGTLGKEVTKDSEGKEIRCSSGYMPNRLRSCPKQQSTSHETSHEIQSADLFLVPSM